MERKSEKSMLADRRARDAGKIEEGRREHRAVLDDPDQPAVLLDDKETVEVARGSGDLNRAIKTGGDELAGKPLLGACPGDAQGQRGNPEEKEGQAAASAVPDELAHDEYKDSSESSSG